MKILVIGGAGYIGSHVVLSLIEQKYQVMVYDNLSSGRRSNLYKEAQFIEGDIHDETALHNVMAQEKPDAVFHLAAFKAVGESMSNPGKYAKNNISGTINILNAMVENNVKNFVFSSSAAIFGAPHYLPIDESHPKNPESFYGFTKLEIEHILEWYDRLKGIHFATLRYFNAAGYDPSGRMTGLEKNPANLLPIIMESAAGIREGMGIYGDDYDTPDGTCVRDYIHVTDLASAHLAALKYLDSNNKSITVNLGSEIGISVKEMVDRAKELTGVDFDCSIQPRRPGDPSNLVSSAKLAKELLDWETKVSDLDTLITSSWNVYKQ